MHKRRFYEKYIKRPFDITFSILSLIFLAPLMLLIAFFIRIKIGNPILFKQIRPGKNEKTFVLYKFRTMSNKSDAFGILLPDAERLSRFGAFLRSTSLDELPSLLNILKGNMSFVGPRPLLVEYLSRYNDKQKRRHEVRPGLTGLAQINGRNLVSWNKRFDLDIEYVDNISFVNDVSILAKTLKKVFFREGISSSTHVTMEPFTGDE